MKVIASILAIIILFSTSPANAKRRAENTLILETVFRYQIAHCYRSQQPTFYFLSYKDHDPPEAVMDRLRGQSSVKQQSQQTLTNLNNASAILLNVDIIDRMDRRKVLVTGSCTKDPEGLSYLYTLRLRNRKWIVTHARITGGS